MFIARGTLVRVDPLGWGITMSEVDEEGRLIVHLDIRMQGKRMRAYVHHSKISQRAFCPVGICVETKSPLGSGVLVRYRKDDGVHEVQFARLGAIGYFSHSALKRTVHICPGISVKTTMGMGTVMRRGACNDTWIVKLPYGLGYFHERSMQCDPRVVPLVYRAKSKWHIRRRKAFAMLMKLQNFAEDAGLVPKDISLTAITKSIAEDALRIDGLLHDEFADCAETESELDALQWEECVDKDGTGLLANGVDKVTEGVTVLWDKFVDVSKDDSDVKRVMAHVDAHTEKLHHIKEQAEEAWYSSAVGSTLATGATRIQNKLQKLTVGVHDDGNTSHGGLHLMDIQDKMESRFTSFLTKVQAKEAVFKTKGAKLFGAVQKRLFSDDEGWLQKTKEKVVTFFEKDLLEGTAAKSSNALSISAAITSATEQWVALACSPEESAAEIMDRWGRREAGDILEGLDLMDVLRRAGVAIPEPIAHMLEGYLKDASAALSGVDGGRGASGAEDKAKSALDKVLESDAMKSSTEAAVQWGEQLVDRMAVLSQSGLAKSFLTKAMGDSRDSKGDELLSKLDALDIDDVFAQAEEAYHDFQDPTARAKLMDDLLDKALDTLLRLLPNIQIDNVEGETEDVKYALQNIDLSGFGIDKNRVTLTLGDFGENTELLAFEARGMSCKFEGLCFQYQQKGFPYISGQGCAEADATEISLELGFRCQWVDDVPKLVLSRHQAMISELNLSFSGSRLSWLYNIMTSLFQGLIRTYVCGTIEKQLSSNANELATALDVVLSNDMVKPLLAALKPSSIPTCTVEELADDVAPAQTEVPNVEVAHVSVDANVPLTAISSSATASPVPVLLDPITPLICSDDTMPRQKPQPKLKPKSNPDQMAPTELSDGQATSSKFAPIFKLPPGAIADDGSTVRCRGLVTGWWHQRGHVKMIRQLAKQVTADAVTRAIEVALASPRSTLNELLDGRSLSAPRLERTIDLCFDQAHLPEVHTLLLEAKLSVQEQSMKDRWAPLDNCVLTQVAKALHEALRTQDKVDVPSLVRELRSVYGASAACASHPPRISFVEQAIDYQFTELNKRLVAFDTLLQHAHAPCQKENISVKTSLLMMLENLLKVKFQAQEAASSGEPMSAEIAKVLADTLEASHAWVEKGVPVL